MNSYDDPLPPLFDPKDLVKTTTTLKDPSDCRHKLNQYICGEKIGKGKHGDVYICENETGGHKLAVKAVKRSNPRDKIKLLRRNYQDGGPVMSSTINNIRKEIAIMKKCRHMNLVRLVEVIDDPLAEKIYMVMEYLAGGPVEWSDNDHQPLLKLPQTRRIIRDTILGLEYSLAPIVHHEGIIHRDIKPANIMYTRDRQSVKIIDFGAAHFIPPTRAKGKQRSSSSDFDIDPSLFPSSDLLKRAGTPSFLAPEVLWFADSAQDLSPSPSYDTISPSSIGSHTNQTISQSKIPKKRPPITKAIDIWSLGVTFYCFLFGHTPFSVPASANENIHHSEFVLYNQICTKDFTVDEYMGADHIPTGGWQVQPKAASSENSSVIHLLVHMLQKDPKLRIALLDIKAHPWLLEDISNPKEWSQLTSPAGETKMGMTRWVSAGLKFLKLVPN